MRQGDAWLDTTSRNSLRVLGSVGEPINPEAWQWYHDKVGKGHCAVVDTWWQTETGGILIAPTASDDSTKAGFATRPLPFITPVLLDERGEVMHGAAEGNLCIAESWPGQSRSIYGDHARFEQTYFMPYPGMYFTGDGAIRDAEGDYRITGRVDDVLNISGHRLGTAEIEAALNVHEAVAESAVVGAPHDIKGQGIHAYVILKQGEVASDELTASLHANIRHTIGAIATPERILYVHDLPKTRSGKIMRRILRKIASGETEFGDISTLADPGVVELLVKDYDRKKGDIK
jgi:acetyl-CoA synthetase